MQTFELLQELLKKTPEEINECILLLMLQGKLDFLTVNAAYTKCLEMSRKDNSLLMAEKNTSIYELLSLFRKENRRNSNAIHRALYNLNESNSFQMQDINERFGYNEEVDKKLSMYWREHNKHSY